MAQESSPSEGTVETQSIMEDSMRFLALARDGKCKEIEEEVKGGLPVNVANQMGQTALHIASLWGNVEVIQTLARLGANVNRENIRGSVPLHFAAMAKKNAREAAELLLHMGADAGKLDMVGQAPYELAQCDDVRALLGGPDPRIFALARAGKAQELKRLLLEDNVESVRALDSEGRSPLNLAVSSKDVDTIKVILEYDPRSLEMPDAEGNTALHTASEQGDIEVLNLLLSYKPQSLDQQNLNQSEYASGNWLLKGEMIAPFDKTPLHLAVEAGNLEVASRLIEAGTDMNKLDYDGRASLHIALEDEEEEMVRMLLEAGADPNLPSQDFRSCIHLLSTRGSKALLELFLEKGARVQEGGEDGWTPLHLAARAGKDDRVGLLIKAGADVNATNAMGATPLHLAALNGHIKTIKVLCSSGADTSILNKEGKQPTELARSAETRQAFDHN